jgi:hypothetical protein
LASGEPVLLVIAGPNGAGKTTFFEVTLEEMLRIPFVNADRIARTLPRSARHSPPDEVAFQAAALMRDQLVASRVSFCMETVFSDPVGDKLAFFRRAQSAGYFVAMIFVGLASAELSARRVAQRVVDGGLDGAGLRSAGVAHPQALYRGVRRRGAAGGDGGGGADRLRVPVQGAVRALRGVDGGGFRGARGN